MAGFLQINEDFLFLSPYKCGMIQDITKPLILAVPKGRIAEEFLPLLEKIGIAPEPKFFDEKDRSLQFKTNHPMLEIIRVRSFDVATLVAYGGRAAWHCGK